MLFFFILFCTYLDINGAIHLPSNVSDQKTLSNLGIKTLGWQESPTIHQSYSNVAVQQHTDTENLEELIENNRRRPPEQAEDFGQQTEDDWGQKTVDYEDVVEPGNPEVNPYDQGTVRTVSLFNALMHGIKNNMTSSMITTSKSTNTYEVSEDVVENDSSTKGYEDTEDISYVVTEAIRSHGYDVTEAASSESYDVTEATRSKSYYVTEVGEENEGSSSNLNVQYVQLNNNDCTGRNCENRQAKKIETSTSTSTVKPDYSAGSSSTHYRTNPYRYKPSYYNPMSQTSNTRQQPTSTIMHYDSSGHGYHLQQTHPPLSSQVSPWYPTHSAYHSIDYHHHNHHDDAYDLPSGYDHSNCDPSQHIVYGTYPVVQQQQMYIGPIPGYQSQSYLQQQPRSVGTSSTPVLYHDGTSYKYVRSSQHMPVYSQRYESHQNQQGQNYQQGHSQNYQQEQRTYNSNNQNGGVKGHYIVKQTNFKPQNYYSGKFQNINVQDTRVYSKCPPGETGQFVYELSCNQFLNCYKGRGHAQNCAAGTLFNPKTLECDFAEKVECLTGPRNARFDQGPISEKIQATCPKGFSGIIPHYKDCAKFINCANGVEHLMDCPPGTLFSVKSNMCDYPQKSNCVNADDYKYGEDGGFVEGSNYLGKYKNNEGSATWQVQGQTDYNQKNRTSYSQQNQYQDNWKTTQSGQSNANAQFVSSHGLGQNYTKFEKQIQGQKPTCPQGYTGLHAHPTICAKFLNCVNGGTIIQDCGPGTVFNPDTKVCDFPYKVKCGTSSTTAQSNTASWNQVGGVGGSNWNQGSHSGNYQQGQSGTGSGQNWQTSESGSKWNQNQGSGHAGQGVHGSAGSSGSNWHGSTGPTWQSGTESNLNQGGSGSTGQSGTNWYGGSEGHTGSNWHHTLGSSGATGQSGTNWHGGSGLDGHGNTGSNWQHGSSGAAGQSGTNWYGGNGPNGQANTGSSWHHGHGSSGSTAGQSGTNWYIGSGSNGQGNTGSNWHHSHGSSSETGQSGTNWQEGAGSNVGGDAGSHWHHSHGSSGSAAQSGTHSQGSSGSGSHFHSGHGHPGHPHYENYHGHHHHPPHNDLSEQASTWQQTVTNCTDSNHYDREGKFNAAYWQGHIHDQNHFIHDPCLHGFPSCNKTGVAQSGQNWINPNRTQHWSQINRTLEWDDTQNTNKWRPFLPTSTLAPAHKFPQWPSPQPTVQPATKRYPQWPPSQPTIQPATNRYPQWPTPQPTIQPTTYRYPQRPPPQPTIQPATNRYPQWPTQPTIQLTTNRYPQWPTQQTIQPATNRYPKWPQTPKRDQDQQTIGQNTVDEYDYATAEELSTPSPRNPSGTSFGSTERSNQWPPPFPTTDLNADYVFEYDDLDTIVEPGEIPATPTGGNWCDSTKGFECGNKVCIAPGAVCDGKKDCPNGKDEIDCDLPIKGFTNTPNTKLAVKEIDKTGNITLRWCAKRCVEKKGKLCKGFNYRKHDNTCFLLTSNVGLSGMLIILPNYDYYERNIFTQNCTNGHVCGNRKCISKVQLCDGVNDCGDRSDEKGCKAESFGYKLTLVGDDKNSGRLEVEAFGKRGYICDDMFGLRDADVACRELGFPLGALEVKGNSFFAPGINKINYLMDDLVCLGNETRLIDCDFGGWGIHNCKEQEIVGVVCKTPFEVCPDNHWQCLTGKECLQTAFVCDGVYDCSDQSDESTKICESPTEIRLVNGTDASRGRLEISHNGIWGTICDDDFNEDAAKVVCAEIGYPGDAFVQKGAYFGQGKGPIWLDQVFCKGNESSLANCVHWDWGEHNCEHSEDVGVVCINRDGPENPRSINVIKEKSEIKLLPKVCGIRSDAIFRNPDSDVHFRVVQGSLATPGEYPWQATIQVQGQSKPTHWCGAVVISQSFVLTAAHCLEGFSKGAYSIVAGDYNVDVDEGTEQRAFIEDFTTHEQFRNGSKMNNDIALIRLKGRGFRFTDAVQPICLPDEDTDYVRGLNCTISGFGSVESGKSRAAREMRAGWIPIQPSEVCKMPHIYGSVITSGMVCAGSLNEGGVDACDGDSGGPLACLNQGTFTLYGLTSWGQHCGRANKPGVYVKVAHYRKWIESTMNKMAKV